MTGLYPEFAAKVAARAGAHRVALSRPGPLIVRADFPGTEVIVSVGGCDPFSDPPALLNQIAYQLDRSARRLTAGYQGA